LLQEADETRFKRRLGVLPGLTRPWQLGGRSELGFEHMLEFDIEYIEHWNILEDVHIILNTAVCVLSRRGAY
jgi:lipopolysaccharide/colanic/teichoic acid biosynthesis glycosyltransferase